MVDPQADVEGQMGLLTALQEELAKALVERDMLLTYAEPADQRVQQANRRITAISDRIEDERTTLGAPGNAGKLPEVVGDFEALQVDLEFASQAYTQALANLALARAEARRQSRYLAAHVEPTHRRERALSPPGAPLRADRALPPARLGRGDARLLQCARQSLTRQRSGARPRPAMIEFRNVSKYYLTHPAGRWWWTI